MLFSLALVLALGSSSAAGTPALAVPDTIRADTEIRQVVLRNSADVRRCYEREGLRRNPDLTGLIEIRMTILPTGRVDEVALAKSNMSGRGVDEVVRCIASVARHWRFERGAYSVETVVLPFTLTPAAAEPRAAEWWA
jgi:hypothetical protein